MDGISTTMHHNRSSAPLSRMNQHQWISFILRSRQARKADRRHALQTGVSYTCWLSARRGHRPPGLLPRRTHHNSTEPSLGTFPRIQASPSTLVQRRFYPSPAEFSLQDPAASTKPYRDLPHHLCRVFDRRITFGNSFCFGLCCSHPYFPFSFSSSFFPSSFFPSPFFSDFSFYGF